MLRELDPIPPASFFEISAKINKKGRRLSYLPDVSKLLNEEGFARVALLWSYESLTLKIEVKKPLKQSFPKKYRDGDSLEFFIDTRHLKEAQSIHQFCHHFLFFPGEAEGRHSREITCFRFEKAHELADPALFKLQTTLKKQSYETEIQIPKRALHGYDPSKFKKIGFAYRINRLGGKPQSFPLSSHFFSLEKHPSFWATLIL